MLPASVKYAVKTIQFGPPPGGYPNGARMIPVVVIVSLVGKKLKADFLTRKFFTFHFTFRF